MALITTPLLILLTAIGFVGGLTALGGIASFTDLNGATPYRYAWFLWSFEVFTLLVTSFSIFVGFRRLRLLVLALLTVNTAVITTKIDLFLGIKDADNPQGRAGSSIDAVIAGLIIVAIVNYLLILAYGYSEIEDEKQERGNTGAEYPSQSKV